MRSLALLPFVTAVAALACGSEEGQHSCAVVRRADVCCSEPEAVRSDALASDPCLQDPLRPPDVTTCPGAEACHGLSCSYPLSGAAWSRLAEDSGDGCAFASECVSDADCLLAVDESICCSCPEAIPRALTARDGCWTPVGGAPAASCNICVEVLSCSACPNPAGSVPRCVPDGTGLNKCLLG